MILSRLGPALVGLTSTFLPRIIFAIGASAWLTWILGPSKFTPSTLFPALALNLLLGAVLWAGVALVASFWTATGETFDTFATPHPSRAEIPGTSKEGTAHAALLSLLGVVYFLSFGGPELLVFAFGQQIKQIPLHAPWLFFAHTSSTQALIQATCLLLGTVFAFTLPVVFTLLFLEYSLGLLSVTLPSVQPYFFAMPLRVLVVEFVFWLSIPWIFDVLGRITFWAIQNVMILS